MNKTTKRDKGEKVIKPKAFRNHDYNGVVLNFPNGNWLSTVWGYCTYSDNHDAPKEVIDPLKGFQTQYGSNTVEVMPTCSDKLMKRLQRKFDTTDSVIGYLSFDDWLYIVNALAKDKK